MLAHVRRALGYMKSERGLKWVAEEKRAARVAECDLWLGRFERFAA